MVLGADTVVAVGDRFIGSPGDAAQARAGLAALSGTTHRVVTGAWLARCVAGRAVAQAGRVDEALVTMRPLSAAEIEDYVASGEGIGRAGAYAIQEHGDRFITARTGAWDTIVGLHVDGVIALYRQLLGQDPPAA